MRGAPGPERWLPLAIVATAFVVIVPALAVWAIVPPGEVALLAVSVPLGMLLSVLAANLGTALWKRTPGSRDMVFADLMLWGWLRRSRTERRLAHAETLLGDGAQNLSVEALTELSALLEARDSYTYGHSQRVTRHAERIARAMGLPDADVARVRTAAALHDVGKLHTPREILNKPGPAHRRGVRGHPPPPGRRRRDGERRRRPDDHRHDPPSPRAARRRRLPGRASPATRSRSARASSRSPTPSTR